MTFALHMERLPRSVELRYQEGKLEFVYLDERYLPQETVFVQTSDYRQVIYAIKVLGVRGAPAIGLAGAAAVALWAADDSCALKDYEQACEDIAHARPTAVNLAWAVRQCLPLIADALQEGHSRQQLVDTLFAFVKRMEEQDVAANKALGEYGAELIKPGSNVLTHCNAGSLATVFYGTALGVVYSAATQGKIQRVFADETRPVGQGARLTTWELAQAGIPVTLICDNMAASLMASGQVDAVLVGADRIAANGDAANKIGTYGVAVLARHHGIPFYVCAPESTFDLTLETGSGIPIEQRNPQEVLPQPVAGVDVWNPAFDVTPAKLITAIITDKGVFAPEDIKTAFC